MRTANYTDLLKQNMINRVNLDVGDLRRVRGRRKRQNSDGADFIITDDEHTKGCNKSWAVFHFGIKSTVYNGCKIYLIAECPY